MNELKPCPFCGSNQVYQQGSDYGYAIQCNCGAMGSTACEDDENGEKVAKNLWNERK
jgi:Lar family restriction alleviation protein